MEVKANTTSASTSRAKSCGLSSTAHNSTAFHTFRTAVKTAMAEIWPEIEAINEEWRKAQQAQQAGG